MTASVRILFPEIFLSAAALLLLGIDAFAGPRRKFWSLSAAFAALFAGLLLVLSAPSGERAFAMVVSDPFATFFKVLAIAGAGFILLLSEDDAELVGPNAGLYAALVLLSTVGVMLLAGAEDLLILFVALELTTVPLFILAGFLRKDLFSSEGALKFFLVGVFSSGLMVYGMSLLYGLSGGSHFSHIARWLASGGAADPALFLIAMLLLVAGLGFKLSLVPFHQWTPDAYQGAPTPITAFFSVSRDAGIVVVMLRLFGAFLDVPQARFTDFFALLSVLTMTVGNVAALKQDSLKRLLAYSSIAHAGTLFIGLVAGNALGREGVMVYSLAYTLMNVGAFAVTIAVARAKGSDSLSAASGLAKENFPLALLMLFFLLSLSGIPPFLGFLGKFMVFSAAIQEKMYWLVAAGLINSVIGVYYYFRVVHRMFFAGPEAGSAPQRAQPSVQWAAACAGALVLALGLFPQPLLSWVKAASTVLP